MKIERWFKGTWQHAQQGPGYFEPGYGRLECLGTVVTGDMWEDTTALDRTAAIIERLFPGRICDCDVAGQVVHFNNADETTREDVDKVLKTYTEEVEAAKYAGLLP